MPGAGPIQTPVQTPFDWHSVPGIATPTPKMSSAGLLANLKLLAKYGLDNHYTRDNTVNPMVTYARIARPKSSQTTLLSLANAAYDAVHSLPEYGSAIDKGAAAIAGAGEAIKGAVLAVPNFLRALVSGALWLRILFGLGGIALIAVGVVLLVKQLGYSQLLPKGIR
jgi:hypothetical protein